MHTHSAFAEQYLRQRERELAAAAARHGSLAAGRTRGRGSLRNRAGWRLVEIGLTLIRGSALEVP
jgi:hypothetical protein